MKLISFILCILLATFLGCTNFNSNPQPMNQSQNYTIFPETYETAVFGGERFTPSDQDVQNGLQILESQLKDNTNIRDLAEYKIQFIGYLNEAGEKILLANYFCNHSDVDWENTWIGVDGGGNCFFEVKVNLDKKEVFDLSINGII